MSGWDKFLGGLRGVTFCSLMILSSSLGAVFVLFPTLPLLFLNRKLFRWLGDNIIALWESYPVVSSVRNGWFADERTKYPVRWLD